MKQFFPLLVVFLLTASTFSQSPEKMSYQAAVRDANNTLVPSNIIGMQISILQGETSVYAETPTTNTNGLVTLEIGTGTKINANFTKVNWANGRYFIKTEINVTGGAACALSASTQLLSVPYTLQSKTAESIEGNLYLNANSTVQLTGVISNNIRALTSSAGTISWTGTEGNLYRIILTEDAILQNPTNPITGATYMFLINQDA
jgi:hypothetical protein